MFTSAVLLNAGSTAAQKACGLFERVYIRFGKWTGYLQKFNLLKPMDKRKEAEACPGLQLESILSNQIKIISGTREVK